MEINDLPEGNTHYVDNARFQQLLEDRRAKVEEMQKNMPGATIQQAGKKVRVNEELGGILYQISENLSYRRNFINYTFREEMVGDGVVNCLTYIDNYDTVNYKNPFAYFTQTCFYAFVRRIGKEDKQSKVQNSVYEQQIVEHDIHDKYEFQHAVVDELVRD